jgi:toxin ParE1/3/4
MSVVITDEASADLIVIGNFIRPHNPVRAATFVDELLDSCYAHLGIRRRVHRGYLIFYRINKELITIIHILNGAQDYETLLLVEL